MRRLIAGSYQVENNKVPLLLGNPGYSWDREQNRPQCRPSRMTAVIIILALLVVVVAIDSGHSDPS
jgi:hypothetical protein